MEPQDLKAGNQVPISRASGEPECDSGVRAAICNEFVSHREVRVSDWKTYDAAGFVLPERAAISDWQARRFVTPLSMILVAGIVILSYELVPGFKFAGPAFAGICATRLREYLNRHLRDKIRSAVVAEQPTTEFLVAVHFELGPIEYGQDLGNLSFQEEWLYFEGELSTFSLGAQDFVCRWSSSDQKNTSLILTHAGAGVAIRIESLSLSDHMLHRGIEAWLEETEPVAGITVLPPLRPRQGLTYSLVQQAHVNGCLIAGTLLGFVIDTLVRPPLMTGFLVIALSVGLAFALDRIFVGRQWERGLQQLDKIRTRAESCSGEGAGILEPEAVHEDVT